MADLKIKFYLKIVKIRKLKISFMKLATHTVIGFPNLKTSEKIVDLLAANSEIVELQIPFSDPVADGPVIAAANYRAVENKITPEICLNFVKKVYRKFPRTKFYLMSYFNPIFRFGISKFAKKAAEAGARGFIVPDLPIEEAEEVLVACRKNGLEFIFVVAPNTADERLKKIGKAASGRGWVYCVARLGITGSRSKFGRELKNYLARVKKFTKLPLGVGFGVKSRKDLRAIELAGSEIGIVGSELFRVFEKGGLKKLEKFLKNLR